MKRLIPFVLAVSFLSSSADEGMWPPNQLPELGGRLKSLGLKVDPASLSDLTAHPMNAVISLGGCTASFVSPEGLVVTNHHCAYGAIQYNSREDRNLIEDGFLAAERSEELFAGPGSRVLVTVAVRDVSQEISGSLSEKMSDRERYQAIEERQKSLVRECESDDGHRCRVSSFHGGLSYYLIKQLEIRDVRLVYAPAGSIGKYGGDIDNWMWPRHTGDFAFYRAYVDSSGSPADPAAENVPYRPKHHLQVSSGGLKEGDFVMVAGYPGSTSRYRLASEARNRIEWQYPTLKKQFEDMLEIIERETKDNPDAAIKYAGSVASLNNVTKNYQGMLDGFAKSDIVERKERQEQRLRAWIDASESRKSSFGGALENLHELIEERQALREQSVFYEFLARRSTPLQTVVSLYRLSKERQKPDEKREPGFQERDLLRIEERLTRMDRRYDPGVDRAGWRHFILRYAQIPAELHIAEFDEWFGITGSEIDERKLDQKLAEMYAGTELGKLEHRLSLMDAEPADFESSTDPFTRLAVRLYESDMRLEEEDKQASGKFQRLRPRYMQALIAFLESEGKSVYPDANGTLRVTFGSVMGYSPQDAIRYTPFTTLKGILEKDTGVDPFNSPRGLLDLIRNDENGRFMDERIGSVPVNFLSTVDSTGGNSGSPTLNAKAELVGLLFDGNYESINSDWDFNAKITRSIHVDMRYVLWVMEMLDDAHHLLHEMGVGPDRRDRQNTAAAGD